VEPSITPGGEYLLPDLFSYNLDEDASVLIVNIEVGVTEQKLFASKLPVALASNRLYRICARTPREANADVDIGPSEAGIVESANLT
jgi:hypothetical protein